MQRLSIERIVSSLRCRLFDDDDAEFPLLSFSLPPSLFLARFHFLSTSSLATRRRIATMRRALPFRFLALFSSPQTMCAATICLAPSTLSLHRPDFTSLHFSSSPYIRRSFIRSHFMPVRASPHFIFVLISLAPFRSSYRSSYRSSHSKRTRSGCTVVDRLRMCELAYARRHRDDDSPRFCSLFPFPPFPSAIDTGRDSPCLACPARQARCCAG